jgi:hypothetical protein
MPITTKVVSSNPVHGEVHSIQHYVIKFVSDLRQVCGFLRFLLQGFQSGPVPGTFTHLRSCIIPAEITEPPKISGGQNHKYDGR